MRNTVLEINKKAFLKNIKVLKKYVDNKAIIMPVVKANAYGTYLNQDIDLMNSFEIVAVAIVDEAIYLRKNGYKNDVLVLNQPYDDEIDDIIDNNIIAGVCSVDFLRKVICTGKKMRVHIELETGMGRTGVLKNDLDSFLSLIVESSNVIVEGVYTHFSSADINYEFTNKQINLFNDGVLKVKEMFPDLHFIHSSASNGILNFELGICNVIRPGMILYGYPSSMSALKKIKLEPVAKFKSKISFVKMVDVGDAIGYGRGFVSSGKLKVATVGGGYADGVRRELADKGYVSVKGVRCKILGKICMDSFMIDVSEVMDVCIGDDVYIFDNKTVTLDEIAFLCGTINYDILSTIGFRVPRVFL